MKADVLTLVDDLSLGQADAASVVKFYDEVVIDLGQRNLLTNASLVALTAQTGTYTLPAEALRPLAMFYDDAHLTHADERALMAIDPNWRSALGTPMAWVTDDETDRTFRLFEQPSATSKPFIFIFGSPFGTDYPAMSVAVIFTEKRDDLPVWLELPVALEILAREFARESAHRDQAAAAAFRELAAQTLNMVIGTDA